MTIVTIRFRRKRPTNFGISLLALFISKPSQHASKCYPDAYWNQFFKNIQTHLALTQSSSENKLARTFVYLG
jgi:hypothetical protein